MPSETPDNATADQPNTSLTVYSAAEAQAIWARAAELQALTDGEVRRDYGLEPVAAPESAAVVVTPPAGLYFAGEITAAARAAGIAPTHVAVAMAEHDAADMDAWVVPTDAQREAFIRELGTDVAAVHAVAFVPGSPAAVISQLREAFAQQPWGLEFEGLRQAGDDRVQVFRFRVPRWLGDADPSRALPPSLTNAFVYNANRIGVLACHVLLVPRGNDAAASCEVTIVADLRLGQHLNTTAMKWVYPALTACFAVLGTLGGMLAATPDAPVLSIPAMLGACAGMCASIPMHWGLRRIMRWEQRTAMGVLEREFRRMLRAVGRPSALRAVYDAVARVPSNPKEHGPAVEPSSPHELRAAVAI